MQSPCRDCESRHYLCHSECEKYIAFRKKRDEILEKRWEEQKIESILLAGNKREKKEMWRKKR